jgi:hypothetical protein
MPKRVFVTTLAVMALALVCNGAFAQGVVPGHGQFVEGNSNNTFPYNVFSATNQAYMQFHAPGEFCVNPPDTWNGGTAPGSGLVEPALISGLAIRPDGVLASFFTATHTRPDAGTFHFMTDMQVNNNFIFFQDSINWNATTITYPGGFTLSFPTGSDPLIPGAQLFHPITSVGAGFTYLGTLTGCCGSCPAPSQGGLLINVRVISGSGSGTLVADMTSTFVAVGIHFNVIRLWGAGAGATGFTNFANNFAGLFYSLEAGGCKTYSELKEEILNAVIVGNPPSDNPPSIDDDPGKNDANIGGLRNSWWKQCWNSEAAFNRGSFGSAGNGLGAFVNHVDAQDGKHLDTDSASDLRNCVRSLRSSLGI